MAGKKKANLRLPVNHGDWEKLLRDAIERAEKSNDRRVAGLKQALISGNPEKHLRKLGIISPADIDREFPDKDKPS